MNILAALNKEKNGCEIFNVASNRKTTLNELYDVIWKNIENISNQYLAYYPPEYKNFRDGDILHSRADIKKAVLQLGYDPMINLDQGIDATVKWFLSK